MKFRFIHSADTHIGSVINVNSKNCPYALEELRNATYHAFTKIIDYAVDSEVDFVLISGDVFDRSSYSIKASKFFFRECGRLKEKNIPIYIVCGNHDALIYKKYDLEIPNNVHIFGQAKAEVYEFIKNGVLQARIIGQSYRGSSEGRELWKNYDLPKDGVFNIALLHTSLDNNKSYAPCTINNLRSKEGIDYWALGHIHKNKVIQYEKPSIVYPGIPQGRDFGEEGVGGFYLVDVKEEVKIQFIPTSEVVYKRVEVSVEEDTEKLKNLQDLERIFHKKAEKHSKEGEEYVKAFIIQWIIKGRGEIHNILEQQAGEDLEELIEDLNGSFSKEYPLVWSDDILIKTLKLNYHREDINKDNYIYSILESVTHDCLENEDLNRELKESLGKIWDPSSDYENCDDEKFILDSDTFNEILERAKELILENLFTVE